MVQTILNFLARLISKLSGIKGTAWQLMEIATEHSVASSFIKCLRLSYGADSFFFFINFRAMIPSKEKRPCMDLKC